MMFSLLILDATHGFMIFRQSELDHPTHNSELLINKESVWNVLTFQSAVCFSIGLAHLHILVSVHL